MREKRPSAVTSAPLLIIDDHRYIPISCGRMVLAKHAKQACFPRPSSPRCCGARGRRTGSGQWRLLCCSGSAGLFFDQPSEEGQAIRENFRSNAQAQIALEFVEVSHSSRELRIVRSHRLGPGKWLIDSPAATRLQHLHELRLTQLGESKLGWLTGLEPNQVLVT